MNWMALLTFAYDNVWKGLGALFIILVINIFLGASALKDLHNMDRLSYAFKASLSTIISFIYKCGFVVWVVMFIANVGHWIGVY